MKNAYRFLNEQRNDWHIILKLDIYPIYFLFGVLGLLQLKNVSDQEMMDGFVCIVYAKLFETVVLKIFKPKIL